jgi:hypothetical protein
MFDHSIHQKPLPMEINTNNVDEELVEEEEVDISISERDLFLNHFDVQLQVNNGQLQEAVRYGVFSSLSSTNINAFKINQYSQTAHYMEPEMDMDSNGTGRRNGNHNGYSQQYNGNNNNDGSYRRNGQTNGSSGNGGGGGGGGSGNGSNPNRNNNNSRR